MKGNGNLQAARWPAIVLGSALLASCAVGPDYHRPAITVPTAFKENADWKRAEPGDTLPRGKWWQVFNDADLNALIEQVEINNQNLRLAEARYRQAQALTQSARAGFFPTVSASASDTRSRSGAGRSIVSGGLSSSSAGGVNTNYNVSASLSWELDLWGRIRRQVEANDSSAQASAADLAAAHLSAQADLAVNYFQLRVNDGQQQMLNDTVAAYAKSLELTKNRYAVGVAGRVDVIQAETQLKSAQAQALDLGVQRAQLEHAIALLLGKAPSEFSLPVRKWDARLPQLPLALPSTLLERRPDIAAAERRAAAANAQIGVAQAAYYPTLSFSGSEGFASPSIERWLTLPNRFWSLGPSLAVTLLDFGKRGAAKDQAVASYDQSVASYRQTVLQGFQDVEDNLAALRILEAEAVVQDEAVNASRESVTLTLNQYKAGTISYLNVVSVQTAQLSNERSAISILGRRLSAAVGLIRALGGGWEGADREAATAQAKVATQP
jgi:NodT family efflux transporter outer membrane factor (OMF) lipoprotein